MHRRGLTSSEEALKLNMMADPAIRFVQPGTDEQALAAASAANSAMCSARAFALHEKKDPDTGKSLHALHALSKRKYPGEPSDEAANFKCPHCARMFYYAEPKNKNGSKRCHQNCDGKSRVLVPLPNMCNPWKKSRN